ncbi:MAG: alpha/beta fold hydrolase [Candidatus Woykebacteria bacterium]
MLSDEQRIELYGGLPREAIVRASGSGWRIETPTIKVDGRQEVGILIQGGIHSQSAQLSHKVREFARRGFTVGCIDQSGAATVSKSTNFYDCADYARFVARDLAALETLGLSRVIAYGSSLGAGASIALAAEAPECVTAVIAVSPASLIRQNPWFVAAKFALSSFQVPEKDFTPQSTRGPGVGEMLREGLGKAKNLAASDIGLNYLARVSCPVLIYTGKRDFVFPWRRLKGLEDQFPNLRVLVVDNFIHSDPNSRKKINWLVADAMRRLEIN